MAANATAALSADVERVVLSSPAPPWLAGLRRHAAERFRATGFPNRRQEAWRFTPIAPVAETEFTLRRGDGDVDHALLDHLAFAESHRLVFVDGRLAPALSSVGDLPAGVLAGSLAEALATRPGLLEPHLGRLARPELTPFAALNAAAFTDGAIVVLPRDAVLERPLHLLFLATGADAPWASLPRTLLVAGENSAATVVETYAGTAGDTILAAPVTEIVLEAGARLRHVREQREGPGAYHLGTLAIRQGRDSSITSHTLSLGARLARLDLVDVLAGEGASATLNGLYMVDGDQHAGVNMTVEHAAPSCTSHELYKGVVDGRGSAAFNGLIHVYPDAQQTNAKQSNRNLLLSRQALANSNPQLRILANDVKCTHGSTVGQLDEDAVFYLRSRGLDRAAARALLTYAFAAEIVEGITVDAVRHELTDLLYGRLPRRGVALEGA